MPNIQRNDAQTTSYRPPIGAQIGMDAARGLAAGIRAYLEAKLMVRQAKTEREKQLARRLLDEKRVRLLERQSEWIEGDPARERGRYDLQPQTERDEKLNQWKIDAENRLAQRGKEDRERKIQVINEAIESEKSKQSPNPERIDELERQKFVVAGINVNAPTQLEPERRDSARGRKRLETEAASAYLRGGFSSIPEENERIYSEVMRKIQGISEVDTEMTSEEYLHALFNDPRFADMPHDEKIDKWLNGAHSANPVELSNGEEKPRATGEINDVRGIYKGMGLELTPERETAIAAAIGGEGSAITPVVPSRKTDKTREWNVADELERLRSKIENYNQLEMLTDTQATGIETLSRKALEDGAVHEFRTAARALKAMAAAANDSGGVNGRAAELAVLHSFMKAVSPSSVVREGETHILRAGRSFDEFIAETQEKLAGESSLTPTEAEHIYQIGGQLRDLYSNNLKNYVNALERRWREQGIFRLRDARGRVIPGTDPAALIGYESFDDIDVGETRLIGGQPLVVIDRLRQWLPRQENREGALEKWFKEEEIRDAGDREAITNAVKAGLESPNEAERKAGDTEPGETKSELPKATIDKLKSIWMTTPDEALLRAELRSRGLQEGAIQAIIAEMREAGANNDE